MAQNEDTEQVSELDSDMTQSLELSDREFKIIMLQYSNIKNSNMKGIQFASTYV